jgi:pentatricopeptide repeat protein
VIKSWNIILNGWCVKGSLALFKKKKGSLADAKRVWNQIIASKLKPELFTYGTFINLLTKAGKISTAVKLFSSMCEKGINPDVAICNSIIDQLCFKKKIPEALEVFCEMNDRGCQADAATYNTFFCEYSIDLLIIINSNTKISKSIMSFWMIWRRKGCSPNNMT